MLSRTDQTWTSDNTDPADRIFIQFGYLSAFPANTMVCWTTDVMNPLNLPLDFKLVSVSVGVAVMDAGELVEGVKVYTNKCLFASFLPPLMLPGSVFWFYRARLSHPCRSCWAGA